MNSVFAPGMSRTTYPFDWWWKAETDPVLFCFPHALREGGSRTVEGRKVGRPTGKLLTWWPRTEGWAVAAHALWLLSPPSRPSLKKNQLPLTRQHHLGKHLVLLYTYSCITCLQGKLPNCLWSCLSLLFVQIHSHNMSGAIWGNAESLETAEWWWAKCYRGMR